ncbi:ATP-binding protein [Granulicella sp. dw_53]|uniref:ATP-binding protein n=1 Tax=Granulicella sp. dw_53 TaxID=2719792 RepID=UPI001BD638C7
MDLGKFKQILLQVFFLPVLALLLLAAALYVDIRNANSTVGLIQQSDERIAQATMLTKLILDEETGLRGYQTTSDDRFLAPYTNAQTDLKRQFSALENVPGANQSQKDHLEHLRDAYETWQVGFAEPVIATIRGGGQANDVDQNLHGKLLMDAIRSDLGMVVQEAQNLRADRIATWHSQVHIMLWGIFLLAIVMGVLIGLFTRSRLHAVSDAYKNSLEMLKRRADEIYASEQELRTTLTSIGDGVIACDADGCVQMMNPVAEDLTGWTSAEASGVPLEKVFEIVNETTRAVVENPVAKVKRVGGIVGLANHTVLIRKDRTELHIADSGAPIMNIKGEMIGIVLVFRDVTMERRTQDALLANEKLAVAGRLAATIAHEIHNPLDSVSNLLYLMRTGASEEEAKQFMAMAEQELARVTQISRAMLGLYRESKTPVHVDLREMLHEILLLMERRLTDTGVTLHTDMPPGIVVDGFPAELRQVFTNLITNAAEATGRGGAVWVSVAPEPAGLGYGGLRTEAGALVQIRDNGPGIPKEIQAQMFQPFFTTKGENGTGLGLWVSRGIVNKHGGSIRIESDTSESTHGSTVSVFLASKPTMQPGGD